MPYAIIQFFQGETVAGWASILVSVLIIGGVMLLSLGVIGEYIARIYHEVKQRPHYFIQEEVGKHYEKEIKEKHSQKGGRNA